MHKKFIFGYFFFQIFSLSSAEFTPFTFCETSASGTLQEERLFYESRLREKAGEVQGEKPFDESHEQRVAGELDKALKRFDEFRTHDAAQHYLLRVEKNQRTVALVAFSFKRAHYEKPVWIGPLVISKSVDQRELWQACKEEARKRGGLTFSPGLNKTALKERDRLESSSSDEPGHDEVQVKELSAKTTSCAPSIRGMGTGRVLPLGRAKTCSESFAVESSCAHPIRGSLVKLGSIVGKNP